MTTTRPTLVLLTARQHGLNILQCMLASRLYHIKAVFTHKRFPETEDPEQTRERPGYAEFKRITQDNDIPLYTVDNTEDESKLDAQLTTHLLPFDHILACSWRGQIPTHQLTLSKYTGVNLHRGELPQFKGADPILQALEANKDYIHISAHVLIESRLGTSRLICHYRHLVHLGSFPDLSLGQHVNRLKDELTVHFGPLALQALELVREEGPQKR